MGCPILDLFMLTLVQKVNVIANKYSVIPELAQQFKSFFRVPYKYGLRLKSASSFC